VLVYEDQWPFSSWRLVLERGHIANDLQLPENRIKAGPHHASFDAR
jgi:hypothetical protein